MNMNPNRLLGYLAMIVVWLNITDFYLFVSALTGVSFRFFGILFIGIMGLYVVSNMRTVQRMFSCKPVVFFLLLFIVIPICSVVLAPLMIFNQVGYLVLAGLLFLSSMIWIQQEGWQKFSKMILLAWAFSVCGIVLSYFIPTFFRDVAVMQQEIVSGTSNSWGKTRIAEALEGRAFGFYMQANRASMAMIYFQMILLPVYFHDKAFKRMLLLGITLFTIMLTGSRTGFVCIALFTGLLFVGEMLNGIRDQGRLKSGFVLLPRYIVLGVLAVIALLASLALGSDAARKQSAAERILSSFFDESSSVTADASVQSRLAVQRMYASLVMDSPILGHGLGSAQVAVNTGALPISSHNNYLETAYLYGVPMAFLMYGYLFYLAFCQRSKQMQGYFRYNQQRIILIMVLVTSFASHSIFNPRMFPVVITFTLAMLYFPPQSHRPWPAPMRPMPPRR